MNYAEVGRKTDLHQYKAAALVKLDRALQALEHFGQQRIMKELEIAAIELDLAELYSITADLVIAKKEYDALRLQLKRLK